MKDIQDLRDEIDLIDKKMVELFEKRMEVVLSIAEYKFQNDLPVLNSARETEVIKKSCEMLQNKGLEKSYTEYLKKLMELSRLEQEKYLTNKTIKL
jgi:monofunctional chorismate mutase